MGEGRKCVTGETCTWVKGDDRGNMRKMGIDKDAGQRNGGNEVREEE